jgi:hypothetical protein
MPSRRGDGASDQGRVTEEAAMDGMAAKTLRLVRSAMALGLAFGMLAGCGGGSGNAPSAPVPDDGDADGGFPASSALSSCATSSCSTLVITNHCGGTLPVNFSIGGGSAHSAATCPTVGGNGASCPTLYLQSNQNVVFFFGTQESGSTVAEFNINQDVGGTQQDIYDLSLNQGFDIGMQITASNTQNDKVTPAFPALCLDSSCPGAFCLGDSEACTTPCLEPNYFVLAGGQFTLDLCPSGSTNSPGPIGCSSAQPVASSASCDSSWQNDNGVCTWELSHAELPVPGVGPCPASCPTPTPTPVPTPTP